MSLSANVSEKAALIWAIADKLTGVYKPHEYGEVILPLTVIRRFDCILADTKDAVLEKYEAVKNLPMRDVLLRNASGKAFYNTSKFTFGTLCQGCLRNSLAVIQNKPLDFVAHGFFARFTEMDFDAVGGFPYFLYHNRLRGFLYGQRGSSCGGAGLAGFIVHSLSFLLMANAPVTQ